MLTFAELRFVAIYRNRSDHGYCRYFSHQDQGRDYDYMRTVVESYEYHEYSHCAGTCSSVLMDERWNGQRDLIWTSMETKRLQIGGWNEVIMYSGT